MVGNCEQKSLMNEGNKQFMSHNIERLSFVTIESCRKSQCTLPIGA